jgi:hypothetical protein
VPLRLDEIHFNHNSLDKRGSALSLRVDYDTGLQPPEWSRGTTGAPVSKPAAYAVRQIDESHLAIMARFSWTGDTPIAVDVRAVAQIEAGEGWWAPLALQLVALAHHHLPTNPILAGQILAAARAAQVNPAPILGEVGATSIMVPPDGQIGLVRLALMQSRLKSAGVGVHQVKWTWQYRETGTSAWTDFAASAHEIYTTLSLPTLPWLQSPAGAGNSALPWTEVLKHACVWAAGARTADDVATRICVAVHLLGGELLEYGCPIGAREMYTNTVAGVFDLSAFVERLAGGPGNGRYVNCTDCACMVTTFANVLGADLWQSRMGEYVPAFLTRDIKAIGTTRWSSPCGLGLGFMYHEVAWAGSAGNLQPVYDACLLVDATVSPLPHARNPLLPANLLFGAPSQGLYRSMLAQRASEALCRPRPHERRRRVLI